MKRPAVPHCTVPLRASAVNVCKCKCFGCDVADAAERLRGLAAHDPELRVRLNSSSNWEECEYISPHYARGGCLFPVLYYKWLYVDKPRPAHPAGCQLPCRPAVQKSCGGALSSGVSLASRIFQPQKVNFHPYFQKDLLFSLCSR